MSPFRIFGVLVVVSAGSVACLSSESTPSEGEGGGEGELSEACKLLATCCERWPEDVRSSCTGIAGYKGPEGEASCKSFMTNGPANEFCPELSGGDGGTGTGGGPVGLATFAASNLGTILPPEDLVDVIFAGDITKSPFGLCDVDVVTGQSACLSGANKFSPKRVGDYDVLFAKSIVVGGQSLVTLHGTRPVILVATESMDVKGLISVGYDSVSDDYPRPGAKASGAGVGGRAAIGSHGGGAFCGKGGGGFDGAGGGATYGNAELVPLVGGSHGSASSMGNAAGAFQLIAGKKITIDGLLNAKGQRGYDGGGGSGGAVLVEAPVIDGSGRIAADGGDGAENSGYNDGAGAGASGTASDGGDATLAYAGGGGGAGRIRLNARTHSFKGSLSPAVSTTCASKGSLGAP